MTTPTARTDRNRRPALDGVRAVAVLAVMTYHLGYSGASGGFLGVDVFFVLSGYLIMGLLFDEDRRRGAIDLTHFYLRRARRLLPALLLVLIFVTLVGPKVLDASAASALRGDGLATLLYVANWNFIAEGQSYFAATGDPSPYRHMWSLAIEEQYYVFLPILLIGLIRVFGRNRRKLAATLGILAAASAIWCAIAYTPGADPTRVYDGADTRVHELLIGAVLALLLPLAKSRLQSSYAALNAAAAIASLGILAAFAFVAETDSLIYRGGFAVFCLLVCVVIATIELDPRGPVGRVLSWGPAVWVGGISYGLYLWHWPIDVFVSATHTSLDGLALNLVRILLAFGAATASFYLVEKRVRAGALHRTLGNRRSLVLGLLSLPVCAAIIVASTAGVKYVPTAQAGGLVTTGSGDPSAKTRILIVGDSVGFSLGYNFPKDLYPGVTTAGAIKVGCGTAEQQLVINGKVEKRNTDCDNQFDTWTPAIKQLKPQVTLWMLGAWDVYDHYVSGQVVAETSPQYATHFLARLDEGLKVLGPAQQLVIPNVPCYQQPSATDDEGQNLAPDRNNPARAAALNKILATFQSAHPSQVHIVDDAAWLCPNGKFDNVKNGVQVREDGVHYTAAGAKLFWQWLMPQISKLASTTPAAPLPSGPVDTRAKHTISVIGDQVGFSYGFNFPQAQYPNVKLGGSTEPGCGTAEQWLVIDGKRVGTQANPQCANLPKRWAAAIASNKPSIVVWSLGAWDVYDHYLNGAVVPEQSAAYARYFTERLNTTLATLKTNATVVIPNVPCFNEPSKSVNGVNYGPDRNDPARATALNTILTGFAAQHPNQVKIVDLTQWLCPTGKYVATKDGVQLRDNGVSFSPAGSVKFWEWLMPQLDSLSKN